ncbi:Undecaprenyl-diphosphatase [Halorubrum californiense DSM 19288]|uniref:Undecaprenyl-diphosphatase n=1 Tax=Halorubrum californiense DSM 19288 TaxID=1227465 RepID=M0E0M4_9EURY|nr:MULTISPECIES: undecaprenyl-diphosphate phosphatase [Halorubrum]ELZ40573.1 Undecaprenyl-diphosphatase [Halorubrum californiense DSM 19288]TKX72857.1 undecaprenyl-diphosphate phosphatase [Halorubrum sp. GN11GM_10-3_MGM]
MTTTELLIAVLAGIVQGVVEWLPVSSQGNLSLVLTLVGMDPAVAVQLALFLQVGTTLSAAAYYRDELATALHATPSWRPATAYEGEHALVSYIVVASLFTGIVGIPLYVFAVDLAGQLTGGVFIAVIGVLLIVTGLLQRLSNTVSMGGRETPSLVDSVLIGSAQGFAILPGISRSGVTASTLLFRSYDPPSAFRLSFLLSIPASIGAALLTLAGTGGLPGINPVPALIALGVSAVVGYLTIDALMRVVERVPFATVCYALGAIAIIGGGGIALVV